MSCAKTIWSLKYSFKVRLFLYLIARDSILTWNNLRKWGWSGANIYTLCKSSRENWHLMIQFSYSASVWDKWAYRFDLIANPTEKEHLWARIHVGNGRENFHANVVAVVYWNIWRERNSRIFYDRATPPYACACALIWLYCFGQVSFRMKNGCDC